MKIILSYSVPVDVVVDTVTHSVERVVVNDGDNDPSDAHHLLWAATWSDIDQAMASASAKQLEVWDKYRHLVDPQEDDDYGLEEGD